MHIYIECSVVPMLVSPKCRPPALVNATISREWLRRDLMYHLDVHYDNGREDSRRIAECGHRRIGKMAKFTGELARDGARARSIEARA